jgi:ribosomal protein S18 acetylase RimI-like enzyme/predicted nucleic acid-binding protein
MSATESNKDRPIRVLTSSHDVELFVPEVRHYADTDKDALGFFPGSVYDEAAQSQNLLVAVVVGEGLNMYAGHLLFGGKFPYAKVYQIFVAPQFRRKDVGRALIDELVKITEACSYLSVSARVASDLPANGFWETMGFELAGVKPGGPSRKRTLNVRVRQLNTRTLFSLVSPDAQDLGLVDRLAIREPVYVIDLNVFWDVVRKRPRSAYAAEVVSAALRQLVHVVVTPEFIRELNRTSRPLPNDPALEFAVQLPILPEPDTATVDNLVSKLADMIFPGKATTGTLSVQDRSDLVHLAVAVYHNANAFVTSEDAILNAKTVVFQQYGVEILHVEQFARALKDVQKSVPSFRAMLSSNTVEIWELVSGYSSEVESFFKTTPAPLEFREDFLSTRTITSPRKRLAVTSDKQIVCLVSWDTTAGLHGRANIRLVADEEHPAVETVLNCVITRVCTEASRTGPVLLRLCTPPGHVVSKKVAILHGFRPPEVPETNGPDLLQKLSIGRPITPGNWSWIKRTVEQCAGLVLPQDPPDGIDSDGKVEFFTAAGLSGSLTVPKIESLLSPSLIIGTGRGGSIAPIRRVYSERLLQASAQLLLEPNREAALFPERVYFSSYRNARFLASNTALLFYESGSAGGRAAVVAISRVRGTEVYGKKEISAEMIRHGVLDSEDLADTVAVTTFDNVMAFERPVPYDRLRQLGCVDSLNLVCARPLSHEQLKATIEEGFDRD